MEKTVIRTENAPAPFQGAPYNQAIRVGDLVFVAGQLGLKPGDTAVEGDVARADRAGAAQPRRHPRGGRQLAGRISSRRACSSRTSATSQAMNEVYARHVGERPPARSTFEVAKLPSGALVEIEAVAHT